MEAVRISHGAAFEHAADELLGSEISQAPRKSVESSVAAKEAKSAQGYWAQQYILALRAPQPREVYILAKTPF